MPGEKLGETLAGTQRVGIGQHRALRDMTAHMVQLFAVALQTANNLAQARRPAKLPTEQRDELVLGGQMTRTCLSEP